MSAFRSLTCAAAACAVSASLAAQAPIAQPGFAVASRYLAQGVQHGITAATTTDSGRLFVAHQSWLYAVDELGQPTLVHSLPAGHWFGPLVYEPSRGLVLASDFTARRLLAHQVATGQTTTLGAIPANCFDLAWLDGVGLLAAANPQWPNPGAQPGIWLVDASGAARELVRLRGASGPLALDAGRDLYVATVSATYPAPPGSSRLLRYSAAQLARAIGGTLLGEADATAVGTPLDGAYDLALDDRGYAYLSDGARGQVWQIELATGTRQPWLATGSAGTTHLSFLPGTGAARYAPFQPAHGGELLVAIADWAAVRSEVVRVNPARPQLEVLPGNPVPRGVASIVAHGAAPDAPCVLFVSPLTALPEWSLATPLGLPLWLGLDARAGLWTWPTSSDAQGAARWSFQHSGATLRLTLQALTLAPRALGTSPPLSLVLQ